MEYTAALEERLEIQDRKIEELEDHGCTMSINPTNTAAEITLSGSSIRSSGSRVNVQLAEMKPVTQKMAQTVSPQATSVAALTRHITNNGSGGGGRNGGVGGQTTVKKDKHECNNYKRMVWHKEADCPEYERNKNKR